MTRELKVNGKPIYILIVSLCVACLAAGVAIGSYITLPPNAPDYIINQRDGVIYAIDTHGTTAFSSKDASEVINRALNEGNYVFIKSGTTNQQTKTNAETKKQPPKKPA